MSDQNYHNLSLRSLYVTFKGLFAYFVKNEDLNFFVEFYSIDFHLGRYPNELFYYIR